MEPTKPFQLWSPKTADELRLEEQQAEVERLERQQGLKDDLVENDSSIRELEKDRWVRVSLKILEEPVANKESSLSLGMRNSQAATERAEKIAEAILKVTKSNRKTSLELMSLSHQLTLLNSYRKVRGNLSFMLSENEQESDLPAQQLNAIREWLRQPEAPSGQIVIDLPSLSDAVGRVAKRYENKTPIREFEYFVRDQDSDATPETLFRWTRIEPFLQTLPDHDSRLLYLKKLKQKLIDQDQSGFIWVDKKKEFSGDRDKKLHRKLDDEIAIYESVLKTGQHASTVVRPSEEQQNDNKDSKKKVVAKHVEPRNEEQVFLALDFLLRVSRANGSNTAKGKLMSFLSGYSSESMRKAYSTSETWENRVLDLKHVRKIFIDAGIPTSYLEKLE